MQGPKNYLSSHLLVWHVFKAEVMTDDIKNAGFYMIMNKDLISKYMHHGSQKEEKGGIYIS